MTTLGAVKLREELQRLKSVERPSVINAISEARAQGDLSENADYDAAKERQGFIEGRIAEIEGKLSMAQIIDPKSLVNEDRVVFAATVTLEDVESGEKFDGIHATYNGEPFAGQLVSAGGVRFSVPVPLAGTNCIMRSITGRPAPDSLLMRFITDRLVARIARAT